MRLGWASVLTPEHRTPGAATQHGHQQHRGLAEPRAQRSGLRVRHRHFVTQLFDYLFVSREELRDLAGNGGWQVARFIPEAEEPVYVAVLEPVADSPIRSS